MTLTQIKQTLNVVALDFVRGVDKDTNLPTEWMRFWDNTRRIAVIAHQDVILKIKETPDLKKLALKSSEKMTKTGDAAGTVYMEHILIVADSIEDSI